jgi:hypothetical protein
MHYSYFPFWFEAFLAFFENFVGEVRGGFGVWVNEVRVGGGKG